MKILVLMGLMGLLGCGNNSRDNSQVQSFANQSNALNIMVVITGNSDGIPGVHQDPYHMINAFAAKKTPSASPIQPSQPSQPQQPQQERLPQFGQVSTQGSGLDFLGFGNRSMDQGSGWWSGIDGASQTTDRMVVTESELNSGKLDTLVQEMSSGSGFEQYNNEYGANFIAVTVLRADKSNILQALRKVSQVATKYDPEGKKSTVMVHMSSHGWRNGIMTTGSGITLSEMASAAQEGRSSAWRRFIFVVDACESGGLLTQVDNQGNGSQIANNGLGSILGQNTQFGLWGVKNPAGNADSSLEREVTSLKTKTQMLSELGVGDIAQGFAHQLIVSASSRASEPSGDEGDGGTYTKALTKAYKSLANNPSATIEQLFNQAASNSMGQNPVYKVTPANVCQDTLRGSNKSAQEASALSSNTSPVGNALATCSNQ